MRRRKAVHIVGRLQDLHRYVYRDNGGTEYRLSLPADLSKWRTGMQYLLNWSALMLYGEPGIGKTAFQRRIAAVFPTASTSRVVFYPVNINLRGTPEGVLFSLLGRSIIDSLEPMSTIHVPDLAARVRRAHESAQQAQRDMRVPDAASYGARELGRDCPKIVRELSEAGGRRVRIVLLIDDVDELNSYSDLYKRGFRYFCCAAPQEHMVLIGTGRERLKDHWEQNCSPNFGHWEQVEVTADDLLALAPPESPSVLSRLRRSLWK